MKVKNALNKYDSELKAMNKNSKLPLLIIIDIVLCLLTIFCILLNRYKICKLFCSSKDGSFYSALGTMLGVVVTIIVFILSFFSSIISLHDKKIDGIKMNDLYKISFIGKRFFLITILIFLGLTGASIVLYLQRMVISTLIVGSLLFWFSTLLISIEASLVFMTKQNMYRIIKKKSKKEIKDYKKRIKNIEKKFKETDK